MPEPQEKQEAPVDGSTAVSMGAPPEVEDDDDEMVFASLDEFYDEYLSQIVRRRVDGVRLAWCPDWWKHPEAIVRIAALWRAFEYLRLDSALGISHWWLQHADPHLAVLMHPLTGPFVLCSGPEGHTAELGPLPGNPSPPEMWDHPAFSVHASEKAEQDTDGGGSA
ncbi:DUF4913 domain-containing protein [Streptomyces sp. NPDC127068]|uniref:DUF4913 domain-containing protein n=1 Tax=Streptomyces sp. NPDC127068 TaxID=3347127 RepID=UPI0036536AB0